MVDIAGGWWPSSWCDLLGCVEKALLWGACQLAITLVADVAGELQFKVLITKAQAQVSGCRLVLVDLIEPAPANGAGVAI